MLINLVELLHLKEFCKTKLVMDISTYTVDVYTCMYLNVNRTCDYTGDIGSI